MTTHSRSLGLNRQNRVILGVCSGLANYFDIGRYFVRFLYIVAAMIWPPTILLYIVLYFVIKAVSNDRSDVKNDFCNNAVTNGPVGRHFRRVDYSKSLYKNKRKRMLFGVCAGLAEYFELNRALVRLIAIASLMLGPITIFAYIIAAIVLEFEPREAYFRGHSNDYHGHRSSHAEKKSGRRDSDYYRHAKFYRDETAYAGQRARALRRQNVYFDELEQRLRRLEAMVTSSRFKLYREFKHLSDN